MKYHYMEFYSGTTAVVPCYQVFHKYYVNSLLRRVPTVYHEIFAGVLYPYVIGKYPYFGMAKIVCSELSLAIFQQAAGCKEDRAHYTCIVLFYCLSSFGRVVFNVSRLIAFQGDTVL